MVTLKRHKPIHIGVIAEDDSDVEVLREILLKYAADRPFSVKKFVGSGCGRLKNKCRVWAQALFDRGCSHVLLLHDLDRGNIDELRAKLAEKVSAAEFPRALIVIPVEEMEAWLLSDESALRETFSLKKCPKRYSNCEAVRSPKEEIARLVWTLTHKRYLNTVHNVRIAKLASLMNLRRCPSFLPLDGYVGSQIFV